MPNPFPGMNPYLEERCDWRGLHNILIVQIMQALNAALPADYVATVEVRCVISYSVREIEPDVPIVESRRGALPRSTGGAAVLERPETVTPSASDAFDLPLVLSVEPLEERQAFVNVMRVGGGKFRDAEAGDVH